MFVLQESYEEHEDVINGTHILQTLTIKSPVMALCFTCRKIKQERQRTCKVALRRVRATTVAVEKQ